MVISVPSTAEDGSQVSFSANLYGAHAENFSWSFEAPSGAVNSPQVNFNVTSPSSNSSAASAPAHWFANPNQACPPNPTPHPAHPYYNSTYTIKVTATYAQGEVQEQAPLTVNAYWKPAGKVDEPEITGTVNAVQNPANHWTLTGHNLTRVTQSAIVNVPMSSQFYSKTVAHENVHVPQYHTGQLLGSYFTVTGFWAYVTSLNLSDSTHAGLMAKVNLAKTNYYLAEANRMISSGDLYSAELAAYAVSDPIAPMFAYQLCP